MQSLFASASSWFLVSLCSIHLLSFAHSVIQFSWELKILVFSELNLNLHILISLPPSWTASFLAFHNKYDLFVIRYILKIYILHHLMEMATDGHCPCVKSSLASVFVLLFFRYLLEYSPSPLPSHPFGFIPGQPLALAPFIIFSVNSETNVFLISTRQPFLLNRGNP